MQSDQKSKDGLNNISRVEQRGNWANWYEYFFAFLGSLVGYGNIWRFPYICYRNGGGAFLIPLFTSMIICGVPIMFLQTSCSQYSNFGPTGVWELCPLFKGIGAGMVIMTFFLSIYYTMIMAWTAFYFANSFSAVIPWSTCDNDWNTPNCTLPDSLNASFSGVLEHGHASTNYSLALKVIDNATRVTPAEEFWYNKALSRSSGIDDLGIVKWELVLCLLAAWTITFLCLVKGIQSLGKVAYVTAIVPYVVLTSFLIRGCTLPGSGKGLLYFLVPRWDQLASLLVWRDAATQIFYSLGAGSATIATLASYNKFHNNCLRDCIIMPILDTLTSLYGGLVIFAYLGYTSHLTNKAMDHVVDQGPGLVFIAYPAALTTLPLPQFWSVLFFFMLFTMGLNSQFVHVQVFVTATVDYFPNLISRKLIVTLLMCIVSFLLGLPLASQGGVYILNLMDWYIASVALMLTSLLQCVVVTWIYGVDRLYLNIEQMIGFRPPVIFKYALKYIAPLFISALWITGFIFFKSISTKLYGFNTAADIGGIALALVPSCAIPVSAFWELSRRKGPFKTRLSDALKPSSLWRPAIATYEDINGDGIHEEDVTNYV